MRKDPDQRISNTVFDAITRDLVAKARNKRDLASRQETQRTVAPQARYDPFTDMYLDKATDIELELIHKIGQCTLFSDQRDSIEIEQQDMTIDDDQKPDMPPRIIIEDLPALTMELHQMREGFKSILHAKFKKRFPKYAWCTESIELRRNAILVVPRGVHKEEFAETIQDIKMGLQMPSNL